MCRCGPQLSAVLRGTQDPLELLFPGGSQSDSEAVYSQSTQKICNQLVCHAAAGAMTHMRRLGQHAYLLEVGGGTGATTATVLPLLAPECVTYWFTDISETFLETLAICAGYVRELSGDS